MTESRPSTSLWWAAYEMMAMVIGCTSLALICLLWLPCALLLPLFWPRSRTKLIGRRAISSGLRVYLGILTCFCSCRFELDELQQLSPDEPLILAANHPSLLDALLILSRLPNVVCVMKAALMKNILVSTAARLAAYITNADTLQLILEARDELRAGSQLLIFPEGSRTTIYPLDPCSPTTALIAGRAGVAVQTLLIEYSTPYLGKAWPIFLRPVLPLRARIRLGRRFMAQTDWMGLGRELDTYFRQELQAGGLAAA